MAMDNYARDCSKASKEAPGHDRVDPASSTNSAVGLSSVKNVSTEQLEQMLAQRWLEQEGANIKVL